MAEAKPSCARPTPAPNWPDHRKTPRDIIQVILDIM
jgi:hypothetical protein